MNDLGQLGRPVELLWAALALVLPSLGCGAASTGRSSGASTTTRTNHGASVRTQAAPASRPGLLGGRAAIVNGRVSQAGGDRAATGLCLTQHHVTVPDSGTIVTRAQAASTRAEVTACLPKAATAVRPLPHRPRDQRLAIAYSHGPER
jgi:hypothetical protein